MSCKNQVQKPKTVVKTNGGTDAQSTKKGYFSEYPVGDEIVVNGRLFNVVGHAVDEKYHANVLVMTGVSEMGSRVCSKGERDLTLVDGVIPDRFSMAMERDRKEWPYGIYHPVKMSEITYSNPVEGVEILEYGKTGMFEISVNTPEGKVTIIPDTLEGLGENIDLPADFEPESLDELYRAQDSLYSYDRRFTVVKGKGKYPYAVLLYDQGDMSVGIRPASVSLVPETIVQEARKGEPFEFDGEYNQQDVENFNLIKQRVIAK